MTTNVLFICSRNQWRSPTAERIWNHPGISVRSAGTSPRARRSVNTSDIEWADTILVMEEKHKSRLRAQYANLLRYKNVQILDIPDEYQFMDDELVTLLQDSVASILVV